MQYIIARLTRRKQLTSTSKSDENYTIKTNKQTNKGTIKKNNNNNNQTNKVANEQLNKQICRCSIFK